MKRIILMLTVAAMLVVAMAVAAPSAFAKQASSGPQHTGETVTHQGNSESSPVVSCFKGHSSNPC
jgi:Ni/Co efflux regulator RcnB